jgi:Lrp/AsnC family transcriptional regulator for asnA, asnC and gidA
VSSAPRPEADPPATRERGHARLLDETDRHLIKMLQVDGRMANTDIARALGISEATARKRISQLISRKLINVVAVPTPLAVGRSLSAIIGISVLLPALRDVGEQLKQQPEVRYCGVSTGRYDIIVEAFFSDQHHLLAFTSDTLGQIQAITAVETFVILDVVKFSYEWEI